MASYDDTHSMNIPSEGGPMYSYGAVRVDTQDILKVEYIEYDEDHLPSIPISAILHEGLITHISVDDRFDRPEIEENNPYHIREINHRNSPKEIVCQSLSNGVIFVQQSSRSRGTVDLEVCIDGEIRTESGEYNPNCVQYDILPDELICKELDISSDIISRLL